MDAIKLLGSLMGNQSLSSGLGGKLLGGLLGGSGGGGGGGIGGLLGSVLGGGQAPQQQASPSSGLGNILGSVLGGGGAGGGQSGGALGGLLGSVLGGGSAPAPQVDDTQRQQANDQATIMIRAMINAAKSDGRIDQTEQENIISKLGDDVSPAEIQFLKEEFAAPLDVQGFARSVPKGWEQQIYALSLTSIELDTQNEAQYLGNLAQSMNMDPSICNQIHEQLGAPKIFN